MGTIFVRLEIDIFYGEILHGLGPDMEVISGTSRLSS
jgi:hypothetical protein